MLGRVQERPVHRRTTLCVQSRVDEGVRGSSSLLGGRQVVHVSPSLGRCLHERLPGAAMRTPSPTRRRRQRRPSGCAMCQKLQQDGATATLGAAASARRSCILSLTRALQGQCAAAGTWSPSTGRNACRMLSCNAQTCETNLETSSRNFRPGSPAWGYTVDAEMLGFNQVQNLLLCRRLRLHNPERCCQECEGLTASSVFFPTVAGGPIAVCWLFACDALVAVRRCLLVSFQRRHIVGEKHEHRSWSHLWIRHVD